MNFPEKAKKIETFTVEKRAFKRGRVENRCAMIYISMPREADNRKFRITVEEIE